MSIRAPLTMTIESAHSTLWVLLRRWHEELDILFDFHLFIPSNLTMIKKKQDFHNYQEALIVPPFTSFHLLKNTPNFETTPHSYFKMTSFTCFRIKELRLEESLWYRSRAYFAFRLQKSLNYAHILYIFDK